MLVPLIAGMSGPPLDGQGKCTGRNRAGGPAYLQNETVGALGALFDWAKSETRVAGFCPWHYNNRCGTALPPTKCHDAKPPCDMDLGAVSLPLVKAKLEEIGRYIADNNQRRGNRTLDPHFQPHPIRNSSESHALPPFKADDTITLATASVAIDVDGTTGLVTGVWDLLGRRNIVLNGSVPIPLVAAVLGPNQTRPSRPTAFTYVAGHAMGGTITAVYDGGATVLVDVKVIDDSYIELSVAAITAGSKAITDLHIFNVPVVMERVAAGAVAAFDSAFALVMLPHEPGWQTATYATYSANSYSPGGPVHTVGCNGSAGTILQGNAWNLTGHPGGGFVGRGAALWGGKRDSLDAAIQKGQAMFGLPSPKIDGIWHKRNAHAGYFLIYVTPATLNDSIAYALQSGIGYICFLDGIWDLHTEGGHYNFSALWGGMDGIKQMVRQIKAAGLKAGMHTMSGNIVKTDSYITPVPDPRLAKTTSRTLAGAVGENDAWIPLVQSPQGMPVPYGVQPPPAGTDVQIGDEIVRYLALNTTAPFGLSQVVRGAYNTKKATHPAGAIAYHLAQLYGGFLPDPQTTLLAEVAGNIARAYKQAGFEMIYFDGLEAHSMTGPTVAGADAIAPGVAEARLHQAFWEALDGHDALTESSSQGGPLWHLNTRTGQTDGVGGEYKRAYMDYGKSSLLKAASCSSLDTPDMGWWGFSLFAAGSFHATTPDEVEYMAARVRAWDASPNFETSIEALASNGRTMESLGKLRPWLSLQLPDSVKLALQAKDTDFSLAPDPTNKEQSWITPGKIHVHVADPLQVATTTWSVTPAFGALEAARLGVRVRALPAVSGASAGVDLLELEGGAVSRSPACRPGHAASGLVTSIVPAPGSTTKALRLNSKPTTDHDVGCSLNLFAKPLNLTINRVLQARVFGDGSNALLAIQLQDISVGFRDYYIMLDFTGWKTVRLDTPENRGLYSHPGGTFPQPDANKGAMREFDWESLLALNFYVTGANITSTVYIGSLAALPEETAVLAKGAKLTLAGSTIHLPELLASPCVPCPWREAGASQCLNVQNNCEHYVECDDVFHATSCRAFDANNNQLPPSATHGMSIDTHSIRRHGVSSAAGGGSVIFEANGGQARAQVTVFERSSERMGPYRNKA